MPVITAEGEDGVVTAWLVDGGDRVSADQLIAEVQAEKVAEEVRAPAEGIVYDLVPVGEPVPQGSPICRIAAAEEAEGTETAETVGEPPSAAPPAAGERPRASPAARRVARELGVDLSTVTGSGPGGRITEADVRAAATPPGRALSGLRAVIARNMRESVRTTAPVTLTSTADVTNVPAGHLTARVVRTVATVLPDHPPLWGTRDGDRFIPAVSADVAVAVQTDDGLVAPVVRDPAAKTVEEVAAEIAALAERARAKSLEAVDYEGACFTVTNLGPYGVEAFTPIINPPQIAILGVGAIRTVPGFGSGGQVEARRQMVLSLTFDHAFVDGAPAAQFLAAVRERLEGGDG